MKSLRNLACFISLCCLLSGPLSAQTASISGKVAVRHNALASAGVSAYLLDAQGGKTVGQWATITGVDGTFALKSLPYGNYVVIVRYQARIIYQSRITLTAQTGQPLNVDVN